MTLHTSRITTSVALGTIAASALIMALTIIGEEYAPLKDWLKATFTHHWLGKSALSIALFILVSGITLPFAHALSLVRVIWVSLAFATLSAVAMTTYFILHTLHLV